MGQKRNYRKSRKYFELSENKNLPYQNLWDAVKEMKNLNCALSIFKKLNSQLKTFPQKNAPTKSYTDEFYLTFKVEIKLISHKLFSKRKKSFPNYVSLVI